ncbi:hypothetical protein DFH28DRAFT_925209 [Melampsora americana]|nr:hypothetical protein DFH28DRAFT_925209 [Melampsora americana]
MQIHSILMALLLTCMIVSASLTPRAPASRGNDPGRPGGPCIGGGLGRGTGGKPICGSVFKRDCCTEAGVYIHKLDSVQKRKFQSSLLYPLEYEPSHLEIKKNGME